MTQNNTLLIELLTEELPPKALKKLSDSFAQGIFFALQQADLIDNKNVSQAQNTENFLAFATPRRLAVSVPYVLDKAPSKQIEQRLMPKNVGMKDGAPSPALLKKLLSLGLSENTHLTTVHDGKQDYLHVSFEQDGAVLQNELGKILQETIAKLPVPKVMSYQIQNDETVNFVRPAHSLLCLHGNKIINVSILGLQAGNTTQGHRFLSNVKSIQINHANDYEEVLHQHFVVANYQKRLDKIKSQLVEKSDNAKILMSESLLHEVNSLVEYPCVYEGRFEDKFLQVPKECLILTMQTNQKYFALEENGKLLNKFLFVSNMKIDNPANIIEGNEKVVRPRLADAEFFFNEDKKHSLESHFPQLEKVIYHNKLGSQGERIARLEKCLYALFANSMPKEYELAKRAVLLCKNDLLTNMVGEFPELQGIMGRYYALHDGEKIEVANAIAEHYQPRFAGDELPAHIVSNMVALVDKLETIISMWSIGAKPTGEKDPYALRRHALGILRILIENQNRFVLGSIVGKNIHISLLYILEISIDCIAQNYSINCIDIKNEIYNFCLERLANYYKDSYSASVVEAVLSNIHGDLYNIKQKLDAMQSFAQLETSQALIAANKRIDNILKKQDKISVIFNPDLIVESKDQAEQNLYLAFKQNQSKIQNHFQNAEYQLGLSALSLISSELGLFFEHVMVNTEDIDIKNNRLVLLQDIAELFKYIGDFSKL